VSSVCMCILGIPYAKNLIPPFTLFSQHRALLNRPRPIQQQLQVHRRQKR
jgi:hypothetical protein